MASMCKPNRITRLTNYWKTGAICSIFSNYEKCHFDPHTVIADIFYKAPSKPHEGIAPAASKMIFMYLIPCGRLKSLAGLAQACFNHSLRRDSQDLRVLRSRPSGCPFPPALAGLGKWDSEAKRRSERSERSIPSWCNKRTPTVKWLSEFFWYTMRGSNPRHPD